MKLQPTQDRVLLKPIKEESKPTDGGIITDMIQKPTTKCSVYAAGPGVYAYESGVFVPTMLKPGDVVLINKGAGLPIDESEEKDLILVKEGDVLLVIENSLEK
jgi:chaperonin GroES